MKPKVTSLKGVTVKVSKAQVDIPPPPPVKTRRKRKEVPNTTPTNGKPIIRPVTTTSHSMVTDNPYNRPYEPMNETRTDVKSENPYNRPSVNISIEVKSSRSNYEHGDSNGLSNGKQLLSTVTNGLSNSKMDLPYIKHVPKPLQPVIELPDEPINSCKLTSDMYIHSIDSNSKNIFLDEKSKITNAAIESEYQNILKIHNRTEFNREPSKSLNSILHHHTHRNGSFNDTIILREHDDTFITFRHKTVLISSTNLTRFWKVYETYKSTHNIVIDSRLQLLIMYATMAYADELLVYNTYKPSIVNLYDYCSDLFKIAASELNIRQIQELFIMKMIISYYLSEISIPWQVNQIMNNLKELHRYCASGITKKSILDIMINYIRCRSVDQFDRNHVSSLYELFHTYFSRRAYMYDDDICTDEVIIRKWSIKNLTLEEVYLAFMLLKESNFMFVKNDDM